MKTNLITLGAGCFWCTETIFSRLKGVITVVSGYADGDIENPTYEQVCSGTTNHAEVIQIEYDPNVVSFDQLLDVFFAIHDPTTLNRQGDDIGTQYRSTVLYHNDAQRVATLEKIAQLSQSGEYEQAIVTKVAAYSNFYSAESYHQNYFTNNTDNRYCQLVVAKKVQKFLTTFSHLLKA
ncbi:peptide-methionine (S)-S-oxide reductase MsrA [Thalassotalea profundi]|uniref:Peptide methionine sulfoxide reductase MsrA n=1 Tax=Thalassotalea profundi TaxID=2036687 RepID=A0ABQ3IIE3_9GAMM|nr:peptide-methionine (S)-S-oxide reductase MsrA [Thalassotalea profundi]GHE81745.1 peptide methionine sulfoxide reductase MsrA [Thalassotalea profundi]